MASPQASSVRVEREARGWSQAELASRSGLSRQSIGAIEAGRATPAVDVALRIAGALGRSVEALFGAGPTRLAVGGEPRWVGARVALARVRGALVAHPIDEPRSAADGLAVAAGPAGLEVEPLRSPAELEDNLFVFGCAAGLGLLADRLNSRPGPGRFRWLARSSTAALTALAAGRAHVAGVHLVDPKTGEANIPDVRRMGLVEPWVLVTLARWELGLVVRDADRRPIAGPKDLERPKVRIAGREEGSGAQRLLEQTLASRGLEVARARRLRLGTHLDVARAVALGAADTGVASRDAAIGLGLGFVPLAEERYDLAVPRAMLADPRLVRLFDALVSAEVRRELAALGYDPTPAGEKVAEVL